MVRVRVEVAALDVYIEAVMVVRRCIVVMVSRIIVSGDVRATKVKWGSVVEGWW